MGFQCIRISFVDQPTIAVKYTTQVYPQHIYYYTRKPINTNVKVILCIGNIFIKLQVKCIRSEINNSFPIAIDHSSMYKWSPTPNINNDKIMCKHAVIYYPCTTSEYTVESKNTIFFFNSGSHVCRFSRHSVFFIIYKHVLILYEHTTIGRWWRRRRHKRRRLRRCVCARIRVVLAVAGLEKRGDLTI